MATYEAYGTQTGHWRSYMTVDVSQTDTQVTITAKTYWQSIAYGFSVTNSSGYSTQFLPDGTSIVEVGPSVFTASSGRGESATVYTGATSTHTYARNGADYLVDVYGDVYLTGGFEDGRSLAQYDVTIPARVYTAHGEPTVSAASTTVATGTKVKVSWAKSGTQGNASFTRFELYKGSTLLYSGTDTSCDVTTTAGDNAYTLYEIHTWYGTEKNTSASVTVHAYTKQGNPTLSASPTTVRYGQATTLTWGKSTSQGNAAFSKFKLSRGSTSLYEGSGTTYSDTPSNATGAQGGSVTYKLEEVHTYNGVTLTTSATATVTVQGGTVTVYNGAGQKKTALVYAYDSSGNRHNCLVYAYDSSGNRHNII